MMETKNFDCEDINIKEETCLEDIDMNDYGNTEIEECNYETENINKVTDFKNSDHGMEYVECFKEQSNYKALNIKEENIDHGAEKSNTEGYELQKQNVKIENEEDFLRDVNIKEETNYESIFVEVGTYKPENIHTVTCREENELGIEQDERSFTEQFNYKAVNIKEEEYDEDIEIRDEKTNFEVEFHKTNFHDAFNESNMMEHSILKNDHNASDIMVHANNSTGQLENLTRIENSFECSKGFIKEMQSSENLKYNSASQQHQSSLESSNLKSFTINNFEHTELYKCSECNYSTVESMQFFLHIKIHKSDKFNEFVGWNHNIANTSEYSNKICHMAFDYSTKPKTNIEDHLKITTGEKTYKCSKCDYKAVRRSNLQDHQKVHTGEKPYKCSYCDHRTAKKSNLQIHMRIHTGEKPFKCSVCEYKARDKSSLQTHVRSHTGEKLFECNECDYKARDKSTLRKHIMIHTGEKPYECSYCDYKVSEKSSLRRHLRIHTGEKPFKCTYCDYTARDNSTLKTHIRTHTGERPFKCSYCDYSSSHVGCLRKHILRHTGEKPFKCDLCDYKTIDNSSLQLHIRIHTNEKPYKCSFCDYKASQMRNLKTHLLRHANEISFKCSDCEYITETELDLQKHMQTHTS